MVLTTQCGYSGRQILPGYGKRLAKIDKSLTIFLNKKCSVFFLSKWNPRKIRWTLASRRMRGKEVIVHSKKRVTRRTAASARGFSGIDQTKLDAIREKHLASQKK